MLDFSYKSLVEYCVDRVLKPDKIALLEQWRPKSLPKGYRKLKVADLNPLFLDALTESRAKRMYAGHESTFGLTDRDVQQFFHVNLTMDQLDRLAKAGRIKVVGRYCSRYCEIDMYSAKDLAQLTDEDLSVSAEPFWVTQSDLLGSGWTKTLIERFLPEPRLETNPRYKCAAPMKLWETDLAKQIAETPEFKEAQKKSARRSASASKVARAKRDRLMEHVQEKIKEIQVHSSLRGKELVQAAIDDRQDWYDAIAEERGEWNDGYAGDADKATKRRWVVNYIRHNLTDYDEVLYDMSGKVGCRKAYQVYKEAVLDKIAEVYPEYANECNRQKIDYRDLYRVPGRRY